MHKPKITREITRVILTENPHYIFATVYYAANVRRTYRRRRNEEPLPKTVRSFMQSPDVSVRYKDHSTAYVPWREWIYSLK